MSSNVELFSTRAGKKGPEWAGGWFTMPFEVEGARPRVALWVELPEEILVGAEISRGAASEGWFAETLRAAMAKPLEGKPRQPARVRVGEPELADDLRERIGGLEVVLAPVPEVDEAFAALSMALRPHEAWFAADGNLPPELIGELFGAAQPLYRLAPWKFVDDIIQVDIPRLGIDGAVLALVGRRGQEHGFLLFPSIQAYDTFCIIGESLADGEEPAETGTPMLSLTFEKKRDVPPSMLRAIEQYQWPVAGPKAYPWAEHRDESGMTLPLSEHDARVLTGCANALVAFCLRNREVLSGQRQESLRESYTGDDGFTVRLTYPVEDAELFEVEPAKAAAPGRNDPCHCGSGKKYKKCHLDADQDRAAGTSRIHALDQRLFDEVARFGARTFGQWFPRSLQGIPPRDGLHLALQWAIYEFPVQGRPLIEHFMETRRLDGQERAWIDAQRRAWLSIWEVLSVAYGEEVVVRDLLSGERRTVREKEASRSLHVRDAILTRVVDFEDVSLFCGMFTRSLPPLDAAEVVDDVRAKLRRKTGHLSVERLRGKTIGPYILNRWTVAVEDLDLRRHEPPELTNTDGEAIAVVIDRFTLDPADRGEVESRLAALEETSEPHVEGKQTYIDFRKRIDQEDLTIIGQAVIGGRTLRIETNSEQRAAALRGIVESACGDLIRLRSREQKDPLEMLAEDDDGAEGPPEEPTAEEQQAIRAFKQRYYRKWLDQSIPFLEDKTPRQAARSRAGRERLDLLLRDMERREALLPEESRYDVAELRSELGI